MVVLFEGLPAEAAVWRDGDIAEDPNQIRSLNDPRLAAFFNKAH